MAKYRRGSNKSLKSPKSSRTSKHGKGKSSQGQTRRKKSKSLLKNKKLCKSFLRFMLKKKPKNTRRSSKKTTKTKTAMQNPTSITLVQTVQKSDSDTLQFLFPYIRHTVDPEVSPRRAIQETIKSFLGIRGIRIFSDSLPEGWFYVTADQVDRSLGQILPMLAGANYFLDPVMTLSVVPSDYDIFAGDHEGTPARTVPGFEPGKGICCFTGLRHGAHRNFGWGPYPPSYLDNQASNMMEMIDDESGETLCGNKYAHKLLQNMNPLVQKALSCGTAVESEQACIQLLRGWLNRQRSVCSQLRGQGLFEALVEDLKTWARKARGDPSKSKDWLKPLARLWDDAQPVHPSSFS